MKNSHTILQLLLNVYFGMCAFEYEWRTHKISYENFFESVLWKDDSVKYNQVKHNQVKWPRIHLNTLLIRSTTNNTDHESRSNRQYNAIFITFTVAPSYKIGYTIRYNAGIIWTHFKRERMQVEADWLTLGHPSWGTGLHHRVEGYFLG